MIKYVYHVYVYDLNILLLNKEMIDKEEMEHELNLELVDHDVNKFHLKQYLQKMVLTLYQDLHILDICHHI